MKFDTRSHVIFLQWCCNTFLNYFQFTSKLFWNVRIYKSKRIIKLWILIYWLFILIKYGGRSPDTWFLLSSKPNLNLSSKTKGQGTYFQYLHASVKDRVNEFISDKMFNPINWKRYNPLQNFRINFPSVKIPCQTVCYIPSSSNVFQFPSHALQRHVKWKEERSQFCLTWGCISLKCML